MQPRPVGPRYWPRDLERVTRLVSRPVHPAAVTPVHVPRMGMEKALGWGSGRAAGQRHRWSEGRAGFLPNPRPRPPCAAEEGGEGGRQRGRRERELGDRGGAGRLHAPGALWKRGRGGARLGGRPAPCCHQACPGHRPAGVRRAQAHGDPRAAGRAASAEPGSPAPLAASCRVGSWRGGPGVEPPTARLSSLSVSLPLGPGPAREGRAVWTPRPAGTQGWYPRGLRRLGSPKHRQEGIPAVGGSRRTCLQSPGSGRRVSGLQRQARPGLFLLR